MQEITPGERKEHSCSCNTCKSMCKQTPCFPTPEEVEKLEAAGLSDQLSTSLFVDLRTFDVYPLVAPNETEMGCVFQNEEGLCALHDLNLKPIEGRLASHNHPDNGLRVWVAKKWFSEKGVEVMKRFNPTLENVEYMRERL